MQRSLRLRHCPFRELPVGARQEARSLLDWLRNGRAERTAGSDVQLDVALGEESKRQTNPYLSQITSNV